MSTEITFQVGDTIRVLPTGGDLHNGLHPNAEVTVEHADETHVVVSGSHLEWFARRFELVKRADATPVPLDASKAGGPFGKGDTVRRTSETPLRYAGLGIMPGRNFTVREGTKVRNGVISVEGTRGVLDAALFELVARATAQPAPEPEPEWEPGTVAVATVRGVEGVRIVRTDSHHFPWATGTAVKANWLHATSSVTDVRPLVVIDPAAVVDELVDSLSHALGERLPGEALAYINRVSGDDRRAWVRGLLAHAQPNLVRSAFQVLGIEATR